MIVYTPTDVESRERIDWLLAHPEAAAPDHLHWSQDRRLSRTAVGECDPRRCPSASRPTTEKHLICRW